MYSTLYDCASAFFLYSNCKLDVNLDSDLENMPHFLDYAKAWLDFGGAARECGNDFGIFVSSLMVATQLWSSGRVRFDYSGASPKKLVKPPTVLMDMNCPWCCAALDPSYFKLFVTNPNRRREASS